MDKLLQTKKYNMTQEKETAPTGSELDGAKSSGTTSQAGEKKVQPTSLTDKLGSDNPDAEWTDEQKAAREQLAVDQHKPTTAAPHDASMRMSSAKDNAKFKVGEKGKPVATPAAVVSLSDPLA